MERLPVESYFLRYAYPCTFILKQRGQMDQATVDKLERCALENLPVQRSLLEGTYKKAFERIHKLAKEMGKDPWTHEVIRQYFQVRHNEIIDAGQDSYATAPESLKELCKVHTAKVLESREDFYVVGYGKGKTRVVASAFVPDAKVGDKIAIHYGYAVERVEG